MLSGSLVALVTPMDEHGEVDVVSLSQLVEYHVAAGTAGLVVMGTTGESATLALDEHLRVVANTLEFAAERIPVIAGCGSNNTRHAIELATHLKSIGVELGLSVTPYYNKPTQEGLYRHYAAIGEASGLAQILYNVPGRTGCDLKPETVGRLAHQYGICGIKEATGDLSRLQPLRELCGHDFALYSGDDASGCDFMLRGGNGVISVTTNIAAAIMSQMCAAALQGDKDTALALNERLMPVHRTLFIESNPIPVKWACARLGLIAKSGLRLPLTPLSPSAQQAMEQALTRAELIQRA
jgi:4-hydroxy-tetrahydrodipicolinate synthase